MGRSFGIPPERLRLLAARRAPLQHPQREGEGAAPVSFSHRLFSGWEENGAVWLTDLLLLRAAVPEPGTRLPAPLPPYDLPALPRRSIGSREGNVRGWERPGSACSPAGSRRDAWKGLAMLKSSLCLSAATWGCIRRAAFSSEPNAARRDSTEHAA